MRCFHKSSSIVTRYNSSKHVYSTLDLSYWSSPVPATQNHLPLWASGSPLTWVLSHPPSKLMCEERHPLESAAKVTVYTPSLYFTDALDSLCTPFQQGCPHSCTENGDCRFPEISPSFPRLFSQVCLSLFSSKFYPWRPSCLEGHSSPLVPFAAFPQFHTTQGRPPYVDSGPARTCICAPDHLPHVGWRCREDGYHFPHIFSLKITCHVPLHVPDVP